MKDTSQPLTQTLEESLRQAGIPFELEDHEGVPRVKATPEVVEFLNSKEALHDPENPVVVNRSELEGAQGGALEYELQFKLNIKSLIDKDEVDCGDSEFKAASTRHITPEVYRGPIKEMHGKVALVKRNPADPQAVAAQFNDTTMVLNGKALGFGWHEFPVDDFSDSRPFFDKWKDVPRPLRSVLRKAKGIPRIHPSGERFLTRSEKQRGVPGAFGKSGIYRGDKANYLFNVLTEEGGKSIVVREKSKRRAERVALARHIHDFPDSVVVGVEYHGKEVK